MIMHEVWYMGFVISWVFLQRFIFAYLFIPNTWSLDESSHPNTLILHQFPLIIISDTSVALYQL